MNYRSMVRAAAEGVLLGAGLGFLFGLAEARANHDLGHGTVWLAAMRTFSAMRLGVLFGGAFSLASLLLFDGLGSRRLRPFLGGVVALAALSSVVFLLSSGPWAARVSAIGEFRRSTLILLVTLTVSVASLIALRVADGFRRPIRIVSSGRLYRLVVPVGCVLVLVTAVAPELLSRARMLGSSPTPSIILISIDTLRADRVGRTRGERSLTPNLDSFASQGASFLNATAPSPWTQPSHASLFTSLLPFDQRGKWGRHRVPPRFSMLAERFRDAGYRTAAFTGGGSMHQKVGFYQGFEVYESHDEIDAGGPKKIFSGALRWLKRGRLRPYFLFVHTYETHTPYTHTELADANQAGRVGKSFDYEDLDSTRESRLVLTADEQSYVKDLYDGDVAFADEVIGAFLRDANKLTPVDQAIVVVFSDHGEDLWDHVPERSPDHGHSLYEELLRVPLVFRAPGRVQPGLRIQTPVSLLDVAPTVLSLAGLRPDRQHVGRDLSKTLRDGVEPEPVPISAESVHYGPDRFSIRNGDLKVIVTPYPEAAHSDVKLKAQPLEIFNLKDDPRETKNLEAALEAMPSELDPLLRRAYRFARSPSEAGNQDPASDLPAEVREQLRVLGYLD